MSQVCLALSICHMRRRWRLVSWPHLLSPLLGLLTPTVITSLSSLLGCLLTTHHRKYSEVGINL